MRLFILFFLISRSIFAQGNFGINVGLNDDNFGSIKNIETKIDDYDLDLKNSTGFHLGVFTEIDLLDVFLINSPSNKLISWNCVLISCIPSILLPRTERLRFNLAGQSSFKLSTF